MFVHPNNRPCDGYEVTWNAAKHLRHGGIGHLLTWLIGGKHGDHQRGDFDFFRVQEPGNGWRARRGEDIQIYRDMPRDDGKRRKGNGATGWHAHATDKVVLGWGPGWADGAYMAT